jgi:hypothetical protein
MKDEDAKYYDPATNPLIPTPEPVFKESAGDGRAPLFDPGLTPEALRAQLDQAFGSKLETDLAGKHLVKMADGAWTADGKALKELPPSILAELALRLAIGK